LSPVTPPVSGVGCGRSCYEELRLRVLAGDSRGPGLAILLSRGMKAWLEVAGSFDVRPAPPRPEIVVNAGPLESVPGEYRNQLTAVLAGMVLHGWRQGRHA